MRIADMHWQQVEAYLKTDDRCVLPIGTTEQHAYLSLCTDNILAEKIALDAAEPLGIPVFPVLNYGVSPYFRAYPGSINIRAQTYLAMLRDILDSMHDSGFRRILIVNGHGGNGILRNFVTEWVSDHPDCALKFHDWWSAPKTWSKVLEFDSQASHASWSENFPWTRLKDVSLPDEQKPMADFDRVRYRSPAKIREVLGDGNFGGYYQRSDEEMLAIWDVAVEETRALMQIGWD